MPTQKTKVIDEGAKAALEMNEHAQAIFKELLTVGPYDRIPVLGMVMALFGFQPSDLEA